MSAIVQQGSSRIAQFAGRIQKCMLVGGGHYFVFTAWEARSPSWQPSVRHGKGSSGTPLTGPFLAAGFKSWTSEILGRGCIRSWITADASIMQPHPWPSIIRDFILRRATRGRGQR